MTDPATRERIRALAIPPAWTDVWICPLPQGHLQAVGIDAKGRRQYRYHDHWRELRDRKKFDRIVSFGEALPELRATCARKVHAGGGAELRKDVVLAATVRLLDLGCFRIGSSEYTEQNGTYGLATLEKRHVRVRGDTIRFDFVAKGGQQCSQTVTDPSVAAVIRRLRARRGGGTELLAAKEHGRWVDISSTDVNAWIKKMTGDDFTAKDFRTWNATVLAAVALAGGADIPSGNERKRFATAAIKKVADYLDDTPTVTRSSYVDPRLVDRYLGGETIPPSLGELEADVVAGDVAARRRVEPAVLELLAGA